MSSRTVAEIPAPEDWDFGDFPYGLEPLTLPDPPTGDSGIPDVGPPAKETAGAAVTCPCPRTGPALGSPELAQQLFWFRWITGHQATFAIWQLLAHALHQARSRQDPGTALTVMGDLTRAYTAMLLYTSSCPKDVYSAVIRPSMFLQHRGFSGTWAPDFVPVRGLLRGKKFEWNGAPEGKELAREVRMYHTVHAGVAAKLVPDGRSLLQETAVTNRLPHPRTQAVVYDNFFLTLRAPVPTAEVVEQLRRRLRAVTLDTATNGLYPGMTPEEDRALPGELRDGEVPAYERDFHAILHRVDLLAAGLTPRLLDSGPRSRK
ncbi:hypothetical protein ABZ707_17995 [Streptomyces sp. NPDC006923]|uniref:hypothetical protein n=1 Tax=Streptomyces sp. NPDC006923 TaxID=3155355 RepID=UPI003402A31F